MSKKGVFHLWENGIDTLFLPIITTINLARFVMNTHKMTVTGEEKEIERSQETKTKKVMSFLGFFAPHIPDL